MYFIRINELYIYLICNDYLVINFVVLLLNLGFDINELLFDFKKNVLSWFCVNQDSVLKDLIYNDQFEI